MNAWSDRELQNLIDSAFGIFGGLYAQAVRGLSWRSDRAIRDIFVYFLRKGTEYSGLSRDKAIAMLTLFQEAVEQVKRET